MACSGTTGAPVFCCAASVAAVMTSSHARTSLRTMLGYPSRAAQAAPLTPILAARLSCLAGTAPVCRITTSNAELTEHAEILCEFCGLCVDRRCLSCHAGRAARDD